MSTTATTTVEKIVHEVVKKDRFGSREGTKHAAINAVLSSKPQTMNDLMKKANLDKTHYNHLKHLIKKGFVVSPERGKFQLTGNAPAKKKGGKKKNGGKDAPSKPDTTSSPVSPAPAQEPATSPVSAPSSTPSVQS